MAPQKEMVIKFTSRRYKKEGVSEEELHTFATQKHAPRAAPIHARNGVLKATMYFKPARLRAILTEGPMAAGLPPTWKVDDHDVEAIFYVRKWEDMAASLADPEFLKLMEEEVDLVDPDRANISAGWEEVWVEDGKVVNIENGKSLYPPWGETVEILTGEKPSQ